jgi:hypothetical protein
VWQCAGSSHRSVGEIILALNLYGNTKAIRG